MRMGAGGRVHQAYPRRPERPGCFTPCGAVSKTIPADGTLRPFSAVGNACAPRVRRKGAAGECRLVTGAHTPWRAATSAPRSTWGEAARQQGPAFASASVVCGFIPSVFRQPLAAPFNSPIGGRAPARFASRLTRACRHRGDMRVPALRCVGVSVPPIGTHRSGPAPATAGRLSRAAVRDARGHD